MTDRDVIAGLAHRVGASLLRARPQWVGHDCVLAAAVLAAAVERAGITCSLRVGPAAWRVGPEREALILYERHCWVVAGGLLADCTLHAIPALRPTATWAPEVLVVSRRDVLPSVCAMAVARVAGACAYEDRPEFLDDMPRPPADLVARLAERASRLDG